MIIFELKFDLNMIDNQYSNGSNRENWLKSNSFNFNHNIETIRDKYWLFKIKMIDLNRWLIKKYLKKLGMID